MIGILDYGVGNVQALFNCFKKINIPAMAINNFRQIESCSHLILPGVGSFDHAMQKFNHSGLKEATLEHLEIKLKPFLGICVGMQMLANSSAEGDEKGLGLIPGHVMKISHLSNPLPHMGWNSVSTSIAHPLMKGIESEAEFYFLHSYIFDTENKDNTLALTSYGVEFASVVMKENVYGMQCHPEKSHLNGLTFLQNFAGI